MVVKTASWIDSGGSWSANYPVSIHVGDSQDWSENEPCVQGVTDFGTAVSLVSLDGASSLEPIKRQEVDGDYTGRPDLPASVIRFSCSAAGRWVHIVMEGKDFLTMGEVEVYGSRSVFAPQGRWTVACSRGTYLYDGNCVDCPKGWTTSTTPPSTDAGPELWTGCNVACSPSMLTDSSTGCKGAWYKGASWPTSNFDIRDCNAICSNVGKTCSRGGIEFAWGLERAQQVIEVLGETGTSRTSCGIMNAVSHAYDDAIDTEWSGLSKRTCGACKTGMCNFISDGPHYDDASGDPAFYSSTETTGPVCSGGHGDMNKYCVCALGETPAQTPSPAPGSNLPCTGCTGCGTRTATTWQISDGSGSGNYPNNADCDWIFIASDTSATAKITFATVDVENDYDYVRVYDCSTSDCSSKTEIREITGTGLTNVVVTGTTRVMMVTFTSDGSVTRAGFDGTFTQVVPATPAPTPAPTPRKFAPPDSIHFVFTSQTCFLQLYGSIQLGSVDPCDSSIKGTAIHHVWRLQSTTLKMKNAMQVRVQKRARQLATRGQ